jgi:hypothetical protein
LAIFSREQAKGECDWLVMTSVFVASQPIKLLFSPIARKNEPIGNGL